MRSVFSLQVPCAVDVVLAQHFWHEMLMTDHHVIVASTIFENTYVWGMGIDHYVHQLTDLDSCNTFIFYSNHKDWILYYM